MLPIYGSLYLIGAAFGLLRADAPWPQRVGIAALWPIGPLAGVLTVAGLVVVAAVAFPWFGALLAAALGTAAWLLWQ